MAQCGFCARDDGHDRAAIAAAASSPGECRYRCHRQTSIHRAGTIFDSTKLPLTVWFQAIYLMTQDRKGRLGDEAAPPSGISYNSRVAHQTQADAGDDGARPRAPAQRVDSSTTPISVQRATVGASAVVAHARQDALCRRRNRPTSRDTRLRMKLTVVEGFRLTEIAAWAQLHLGTGTRVVSDGLALLSWIVTAAGCVHEPVVVGSGRAAVERPEFRWVNTILGNIKNALRGIPCDSSQVCSAISLEFEYRFNRRFDLPDIIPRLVYVALRTPPMPESATQVTLSLSGRGSGTLMSSDT